jgi:predicted nucleotidyltransferase component of viral defense system
MRLAEHSDFAAFLTAAATESELPETFVEKDYWITEILRTVATTLGERAIFKGGTSLSKGWDLLDRFSEDIDLFVDPAGRAAAGQRTSDQPGNERAESQRRRHTRARLRSRRLADDRRARTHGHLPLPLALPRA